MKHALCLSVAVVAFAAVLAAASSPISPTEALADLTARTIKEGPAVPAPRTRTRAMKVLVVDVKKLARDFAHKRYRSVCSDLAAKERSKLGGTKGCMLRVELLNSVTSIRRFTLIKANINRKRTQANISVRINGSRKHVLRGLFRWEGGMYRLDHETGA
jgi:hypothetical protein